MRWYSIICGMALLLSACGGGSGESGSNGASVPPAQSAAGILDIQGGAISSATGIKLSVPPGAVSQPLAIYVKPVAEVAVPTLPSGMAKVGSIYSMEPHGTQFATPVTIHVPFDPGTLPLGSTPALFKAQPGGTFVEITPVTVQGKELIAQVSSFSFFTAMAKPAPANRPPLAQLTPPTGTLLAGQSLAFSSAGSNDPENALKRLLWNFGDGSSVQSQTLPGLISHRFNEAGLYTVTLTAEDEQGRTQTVTTQVNIGATANTPPVVVLASSDTSTVVGKSIAFSSSGTADPDGSVVRYDWDLGDGTLLTRTSQEAVSHRYDSVGRKVIRLTAVDDRGASSTATLEIQVRLNAAPLAGIDISGTRQVNQDLTFLPTGSLDTDGTIARYDWDFGDGLSASQTGSPSPLVHRFSTPGTYTVGLTVTDNDGASSVAQQSLTITSQPPANKSPNAQFSATLSSPTLGQEIGFNPAASSDPDGRIVSYLWSFGDGTSATSSTPDIQWRSYGTSGIATVRLTVTDDRGATNAYTLRITIQSFAPNGVLNDTGIHWCSNLTGTAWINFAVCTAVNWAEKMWGSVQDAWFGRDAQALAGTLNKVGSGVAGFDFTRLGAEGQPLAVQTGTWSDNGSPATGTRWDCVRDNTTGLVWEAKRNDPAHLRHYLHQFTWYDSKGTTNGGWAGQPSGGTCTGLADAGRCNIEAYRDAINRLLPGQALCGFRDWRIPTREELRNLAHTGASAAPAIDTAHFPNTFTGYHWSSSPDASDPGAAWGISYTLGDDFFDTKNAAYPVRLVRSGS
ncbi:MAG: PKD domain-containing protein [Rhodoferax sp.]|nr:PKD domain-containing protein [Rhodoferax sp.]